MADRAFLEQFRSTPEGQALLGVLRHAEGTAKYKDPYKTLFGGGQISDVSRHPDRVIRTPGFERGSSAAGAYQFLTPTWNQQAQKLGLRSFGPLEQDIAALDLARNRLRNLGGLSYLKEKGLTREALAAMAPEWASLPTMAGQSYYGQPVKSAAELQKVYQQYYGRPVQATQGQRPTSVNVSAAKPNGGAAPTQQTSTQKPPLDFFQTLMRGAQGMFGTTAPRRSSTSDAYFDAAMEYDAAGDTDTALALYTKAIEADGISTASDSSGIDTFSSVLPQVISEYLTAASTPGEAPTSVVRSASSPPAATKPNLSGAPAGTRLAVGKVIDPRYDVFPTTGAHLDVRVLKGDQYVNPEIARSMLQNLYVGGKPLYTQQGGSWQATQPITSRYGPRSAPTAGASTYHRGIDIGVGAQTPLEWRGGGNYRYDKGYGVIETTDPSGQPYTIKLLHTTSN